MKKYIKISIEYLIYVVGFIICFKLAKLCSYRAWSNDYERDGIGYICVLIACVFGLSAFGIIIQALSNPVVYLYKSVKPFWKWLKDR